MTPEQKASKIRTTIANMRLNPSAAIRSLRLLDLSDTEILEEITKFEVAARGGEESSELIIICGNDVKREHRRYLWEPYLPSGKLIHFGGAPSQGKSPVTIDLIARMTAAAAWPDGQAATLPPRNVILMNIEDSLEDDIMPRFDLAGGDDSRLFYVRGTKLKKKERVAEVILALDRDMILLADMARNTPELGAIVIDPITNYLGKLNMNREDEVRSILGPLALLARELDICVITVGHFNKREMGADPLGRVMGAAAFTGVARAVYVFGPDPDEESPYSHIMSAARGAIGDDSLKYKTSVEKKTWDGETSKVIKITWEGSSRATAEDAVNPVSRADKYGAAQAGKILKEFLRSGKQPAARCIQILKEAGYDVDKLNPARVRRAAGAMTEQRDKQHWWFLGTDAVQGNLGEF